MFVRLMVSGDLQFQFLSIENGGNVDLNFKKISHSGSVRYGVKYFMLGRDV